MKVYKCASCEETFFSSREDAESEAEMLQDIPEAAGDPDLTVMCGACYREMLAWYREHPEVKSDYMEHLRRQK